MNAAKLNSDCPYCPDIHWIYIALPYELRYVTHIVVRLRKRHQTHDHARKAAAVHTAYTIADSP